jgi:hypothetical protein
MPTYRGLEVAYQRHPFKTIINIFPEDTHQRSSRLPDEERFVREHNIVYLQGSAADKDSDEFLDATFALARNPDAWPILLHCHGCMDRSPAWMGLYRFLEQGVPLDAVFQEIEAHRGDRHKASVTLLYNRVLADRAPARFAADPASKRLVEAAHGIKLEATSNAPHALSRAGEVAKRP